MRFLIAAVLLSALAACVQDEPPAYTYGRDAYYRHHDYDRAYDDYYGGEWGRTDSTRHGLEQAN